MPTTRRPPSRRRRRRTARIALQVACAGAAGHTLPARRLRALLLAAGGSCAQITVRVVGRAEARRLNRIYRGRDYATNVLAFDYAAAPRAARQAACGDLVLCHAVVVAEARAQHKALAEHYAHLLVHGALHLRGYVHDDAREAARMERRERSILRRFGVADPYLVR